MKEKNIVRTVIAGIWLATVGSNANAAYSYDFSTDPHTCTTCSGVGNAWTFSDTVGGNTVNVNVSAFANYGSGSTLNVAELHSYTPGGLGVDNHQYAIDPETSSPNHAIDNNKFKDSVLFDFGSKSVAINQLTLGWWSGDTDVTVLAYVGAGAVDTTVLKTNTYNSLLASADWKSFVLTTGGTNKTFNNNADSTLNTYSSYWLVGAINTTGDGKDYWKLQTLTADLKLPPPPPGCTTPGGCGGNPPSQVPAPAPLALMFMGIGMLAVSRYKK